MIQPRYTPQNNEVRDVERAYTRNHVLTAIIGTAVVSSLLTLGLEYLIDRPSKGIIEMRNIQYQQMPENLHELNQEEGYRDYEEHPEDGFNNAA